MNNEKNWGAEPARAPALMPGEELIFDECGRALDNGRGGGSKTCYRSHYFRVLRPQYGGYVLRVKHDRYRVLHTIYQVQADARREGYRDASDELKRAFVEGRLKKRKERGAPGVKVWIERQMPARAAVSS